MPSARAARLIEHLLSRQQARAPVLERTTRLPHGWGIWLRNLPPLPRPLHAREIVQALLPRPQPVRRGVAPQLSLLQALRQLSWQHWDPAPSDQRWMRWASAAISALLHLLFFVVLLWVAVVSVAPEPAEGGDGQRIEVAFIGAGTPRDDANPTTAAEPAPAAAAAEPAAATPPASRPDPTVRDIEAASPGTAAPAAAAPSPPPPPPPPPQTTGVAATTAPPSPVQATDVAEASSTFIVPPISVPRTEVSVLPRAPVLTVPERPVQVVEPRAVAAPPLAPRDMAVRDPAVPLPTVRERTVAMPVAAPQAMPMPGMTAPRGLEQAASMPAVRERTVTMPPVPDVRMAELRPRTPAATATPEAPLPTVRERSVPNPAAPAPAAQTANTAAAAPPTQAPSASAPAARLAPDPGNWATPQRGDDWGAASRSAPGATAAAAGSARGRSDGVFNADGSVRLPGDAQEGSAQGRGAPGGANDGWSRERLAQSGTWLKRPPYDYTPTSFDKYWVPSESLLAEWVRKGIKSIEIPIPGSSSSISCVLSLLQAGAGCGLTDPNMQEQPAVARPPPDIPFKPELQEGNGSR